jgi:hypothetical protein
VIQPEQHGVANIGVAKSAWKLLSTANWLMSSSTLVVERPTLP